jgi:hypothetical protein
VVVAVSNRFANQLSSPPWDFLTDGERQMYDAACRHLAKMWVCGAGV